MDREYRSLSKAISWRIAAVFITFFISFIVTGKLIVATSIGLIDSLVKVFVYYFHERAWEKIRFGRK